MSKKIPRAMLSANFKRDYVAMLAVVLFLVIISSELVLAISIPMVLRYTNLYAEHEGQQLMIDRFDNTRNFCRKTPVSNSVSAQELKLMLWDLDALSGFLRQNSLKMAPEQVEEVSRRLDQYFGFANRTADNTPICNPTHINFNSVIQEMTDSINQSASGMELDSKEIL